MTSRILLSLAAVGITAGAATATPLNLVLASHPDIASSGIDVVYNAGTLALVADGFSITYEDDGLPGTPAHTIFGGTLLINVNVTNGGTATGGSLTIMGAIPTAGIPAVQTLLSGSLTDFGFSTAGVGRLEFVFGSLGGVLAPQYLAVAPVAGTILNNVNNFPNNFNVSWNNLVGGQAGTGSAVADTASVPTPASALLLALGAGVISRRRR